MSLEPFKTPAKPCPFCGHQGINIEYFEEDCRGAMPRWIECGNEQCGCMLWVSTSDIDEAVEEWNSRPLTTKDGQDND